MMQFIVSLYGAGVVLMFLFLLYLCNYKPEAIEDDTVDGTDLIITAILWPITIWDIKIKKEG